ncbi:MAG: hypothetical protein RL199_514, partial [Pseudomonadota bacterium]
MTRLPGAREHDNGPRSRQTGCCATETAGMIPMKGSLERWAAVDRAMALVGAVLVAVGLVVLVRFTRHGPWNQDEFQHAHIAWQTLEGRLLFRDFFEHHGPLFAVWNAMVFALSGSVPGFDALVRLRWVNAAAVAATGLVVHRLARRLTGSRSTALACAAVYGASPVVTWIGVQPRPDVLVGFCLFAALGLLVRGRPLAAGLWLGASVGLHPKAVLMAGGLAGAVVVEWGLGPADRTARRLAASLGRLAAGAAVVPLLCAAVFLLLGAWRPFVEGMWNVNATALGGRLAPGAMAPHSYWLLWRTSGEVVLVFGIASGLWAWDRLRPSARPPVSGRWLVATAAFGLAAVAFLPSYPHILLIAVPFLALAPAVAPAPFRRLVTVLVLGGAVAGTVRSVRGSPAKATVFSAEQRRL